MPKIAIGDLHLHTALLAPEGDAPTNPPLGPCHNQTAVITTGAALIESFLAAVGGSCAQARSDGPLYREIVVILENLPGLSNAPDATKAGLLTIVLDHPPKCP